MKLGFIGCGNMARAIIGGMLNANAISCDNIYVSDPHKGAMESAQKQYGVNIMSSNKDIANNCDIIILAIKPAKSKEVLTEIVGSVDGVIVVSIMAGVTLGSMEAILGEETKLVRTMPNTPALVGAGMTALCVNANVIASDIEQVISLLSTFSRVEQIDEKLMDTVSAVSGASPAYAFIFIEAMADAAVLGGVPRDKAYTLAAQALMGSAKMMLETGMHPGALKDMVCSPGGTTIEGVKVLEENGFRGTVMKAVKASADKSVTLLNMSDK